ncbi:cobaltochelatase CobN, partial [Candidatus Methanomarinus sp.]
MFKYIGKETLSLDYDVDPPQDLMWQGIYHPDARNAFENIDDYLEWYKPSKQYMIGILFFRTYWANGDIEIVDTLVRELEKKFDVIPAFCHGMGDKNTGIKTSGEVTDRFFKGRIDIMVDLQSIFHAGSIDDSVNALKILDVPVIHPLVSYYSTMDEWNADIAGMSSSQIGWSVAMPEFEGVIEPVIIGVSQTKEGHGSEFECH